MAFTALSTLQTLRSDDERNYINLQSATGFSLLQPVRRGAMAAGFLSTAIFSTTVIASTASEAMVSIFTRFRDQYEHANDFLIIMATYCKLSILNLPTRSFSAVAKALRTSDDPYDNWKALHALTESVITADEYADVLDYLVKEIEHRAKVGQVTLPEVDDTGLYLGTPEGAHLASLVMKQVATSVAVDEATVNSDPNFYINKAVGGPVDNDFLLSLTRENTAEKLCGILTFVSTPTAAVIANVGTSDLSTDSEASRQLIRNVENIIRRPLTEELVELIGPIEAYLFINVEQPYTSTPLMFSPAIAIPTDLPDLPSA